MIHLIGKSVHTKSSLIALDTRAWENMDMEGKLFENHLDLLDGSTLVGKIEFPYDEEGNMVITHTFVSPDFRGQGIAGKLMERALEIGRQRKCGVIPVCSYAVSYMEKKGLLK